MPRSPAEDSSATEKKGSQESDSIYTGDTGSHVCTELGGTVCLWILKMLKSGKLCTQMLQRRPWLGVEVTGDVGLFLLTCIFSN